MIRPGRPRAGEPRNLVRIEARLPADLVAELRTEAQERRLPLPEVIRQRLARPAQGGGWTSPEEEP